MNIDIKHIFKSIVAIATYIFTIALVHSCTGTFDSDYNIAQGSNKNESGTSRIPSIDTRHTFIMFSLAHNNLAQSLREDIEEIKHGFIPTNKRTDDVLLVFSHNAGERSSWNAPASPILTRIYRNSCDEIITDTLKTWSEETISASPALFHEVFEYSRKLFPSASYGALFSSHGTGYVPVGFYLDPNSYIYYEKEAGNTQKRMEHYAPIAVPYIEPDYPSDWPLVKSFGQDVQGRNSYEMDLIALVNSIPSDMRLSYALFDACLMGGIEVAHEFSRKCDVIGFSQAEILSDGFVYTSLGEHLLKGRQRPDKICEDYFNQYNSNTGEFRSATISCIDCKKLDRLAECCKELFSKYRNNLEKVNHAMIQKYFRSNHHWYYDLESIIENIGVTPEEMDRFHKCLDDCTIYKGATPSFLPMSGGFNIDTFSGLSMYLPSYGHRELDKYYRNLSWNKATGLVL